MSQVPKGYKKTEIGIIPEDWEVKRLVEVAEITMGQSPNSKNYNDRGIGWPLIQGNADIVKRKTIKRIFTTQLTKFSKKGEIILTVRAPVGEIALNIYDVCIGRGVCSIKPKIVSMFLFYDLDFLKDKWKIYSEGSTYDSVDSKIIKYFEIILPPLHEQRAIAQVLSDIDHLIESLDKLIEKKKLIKKGAMQELLTGKKRLPGFSGKWVRKKLEEVVNHFKGRGLSKEKLNVNGKYECILYGELYTTYREIIKIIRSRTNHCEGMLSKKGDILFPSSTTTTGIDLANASTILKDNVLLGGDIIVLRPKKKFDSIFLTYYLNEVKKQQIAEKTTGITIYHLYGRDLMDTEIFIPPTLEEQRAIAQILSDMDSEIESLENKKKKYEQIKKGAMQLLLTGKIRLKDYVKEDIEDVSTSK